MKNKLTIVQPPVAESDVEMGLVSLTKFLTKRVFNGQWQGGGLLGGQFGCGVNYENNVFKMKPYCWCERDDCLWCMMNDPAQNPKWKKMRDEIEKKFGKECADWGGAPQFYFKPTKIWIRWYKWIGRDTEIGGGKLPKNWLSECKKSVSPKPNEDSIK